MEASNEDQPYLGGTPHSIVYSNLSDLPPIHSPEQLSTEFEKCRLRYPVIPI